MAARRESRDQRRTDRPRRRRQGELSTAPRTSTMAVLLFAALASIYILNFRVMSAGDSIPTRLLPFSLLRERNVDLDEFSWERDQAGHLPYYLNQPESHIYSVSTIATPLVVAPLYALPAWWLALRDISYDDVRARVVVVVMERIS